MKKFVYAVLFSVNFSCAVNAYELEDVFPEPEIYMQGLKHAFVNGEPVPTLWVTYVPPQLLHFYAFDEALKEKGKPLCKSFDPILNSLAPVKAKFDYKLISSNTDSRVYEASIEGKTFYYSLQRSHSNGTVGSWKIAMIHYIENGKRESFFEDLYKCFAKRIN